MPQTRFVLKKALEQRLRPLSSSTRLTVGAGRGRSWTRFWTCSSSWDAARSNSTSVSLRSGTDGYALRDPHDEPRDIEPLFEMILQHIPPPEADPALPFQMQVTSLDYDDHPADVRRQILRGVVRQGEQVAIIKRDGSQDRFTVTKVLAYETLSASRLRKQRRARSCF